MTRKTAAVTGERAYRARSLAGAAMPHAPHWLAWLLLPVAPALARTYWLTSVTSAALATCGVFAAVIVLTAFTWHVFRARGHSIRMHATASVGAGGAWLLAAMVAGNTSGIVAVWLLGGVTLCAAWTLRRIARGDGSDSHDSDGGAQLTKAIGMTGARFGTPKVEGAKVTVPVKLVGGEQVTSDMQAAKKRLESKLGLRPGAVRVLENKAREDNPTVVIVPKDPLVKPIAWKGPNAPGESIAEEIEFATYDDARRTRFWLTGSSKPVRVAAHYAIAGMTGSGKTEGGLIIATNILTRADVSLIYIDAVKGVQSILPIIDGVDFPVIEKAKAQRVMKSLLGVGTVRTNWLGERGFKQWEPGCGLKFLVIHIEESAALIADSDLFVKQTERLRSAGICLMPSQQRWSHDRVETSARENMGGGICYGVASEVSAGMVLSEETIDAGAEPWKWKNEKPGYLYLEGPGIDRSLWPVPARSDLADPAHLTEVVAEFAQPGLDHVTAQAFGTIYAEHVSLVAEGKAPWQQPLKTATKMPAPVAADDADDADDDEPLADDDEPAYEHDVPEQPEPGFMDDIDTDQDIPDDDDNAIALGLPVDDVRIGRAEAVSILRAELDKRAAEGAGSIRPADLIEVRQRIGRSASWLSGELATLVDEGYLTPAPDRGEYELPVPVTA